MVKINRGAGRQCLLGKQRVLRAPTGLQPYEKRWTPGACIIIAMDSITMNVLNSKNS